MSGSIISVSELVDVFIVPLMGCRGGVLVATLHNSGREVSVGGLSLIHISEPTRHLRISYAVFCLKKKKKQKKKKFFFVFFF